MIEMPPLQFAQTNGIRMGYYEAGSKRIRRRLFSATVGRRSHFRGVTRSRPWADAGIRVIAPDQRGYGATDRPEASSPTTSSI